MSVVEDPRPGRHSTSTNDDHVERLRAVIRGNRCLTAREVADEVGISIGSCDKIIIAKLQMRRVSAKFVPHLLIDEQKENLVEISQELPRPPHSQDLAPADFFLFPKLKTTERTSFLNHRGDLGKCDKRTARNHRKCFPRSIPKM
jgi:hypothetical protein